MQKLQQLLEKHKEKLRDRGESVYSLSDLIFSSSFLSLLEWNDDLCEDVWIKQKMKDWKFVEWHSVYDTYHKINLALLNTDKERIEYIESFTL